MIFKHSFVFTKQTGEALRASEFCENKRVLKYRTSALSMKKSICPILFKGVGIPGPSELYHGASLQSDSAPTLPVSGPVNSASQPQPVPSVGVSPIVLPCHSGMKGSDSSYFSWVMEWTFSASQLDIHGRTDNNACVFIAFLMGNMSFEWNLTWPTGDLLHEFWKGALHEAMINGNQNQIHDDLFDNEATNVTVVKADSLAGDECSYNHFSRKLIYLVPQSIS